MTSTRCSNRRIHRQTGEEEADPDERVPRHLTNALLSSARSRSSIQNPLAWTRIGVQGGQISFLSFSGSTLDDRLRLSYPRPERKVPTIDQTRQPSGSTDYGPDGRGEPTLTPSSACRRSVTRSLSTWTGCENSEPLTRFGNWITHRTGSYIRGGARGSSTIPFNTARARPSPIPRSPSGPRRRGIVRADPRRLTRVPTPGWLGRLWPETLQALDRFTADGRSIGRNQRDQRREGPLPVSPPILTITSVASTSDWRAGDPVCATILSSAGGAAHSPSRRSGQRARADRNRTTGSPVLEGSGQGVGRRRCVGAEPAQGVGRLAAGSASSSCNPAIRASTAAFDRGRVKPRVEKARRADPDVRV